MPDTTSQASGYDEGYGTGEGGAVTQITSQATTVVLNKPTGAITMFAAVLAADTTVSFTLTNSHIAAGDVLVFNVSGTAVAGAYKVDAVSSAGSAVIAVHNLTPTNSASEAPVIAFAVIKGATA